MKLHQFFEARQMKDPTKDSLVSKNGKVIVIDKDQEENYLEKGWELAEAYPVYKTKDYIDRQDRNLKKTPEEKPKKVTKLSDLVKDLSGKSTKLRDFGKGIFKFDEEEPKEAHPGPNFTVRSNISSSPKPKGHPPGPMMKMYGPFDRTELKKKLKKKMPKDLSGKSTKLRDFGKGIFKFDEDLDPKTATKKQIRQADIKGEIGAKYKDMKAGEFAKAHGDQWRKKKPVVRSTKKDKLVSISVKEGTMIGGLIRYEDQTDEEYIDALKLYAEFHKEPRPANEETTQMVSAFLSDDELFDDLMDAEDQGYTDVREKVDNRLEQLGGLDPDLAKQSGLFDVDGALKYQESTDINDLRKRAGLKVAKEEKYPQSLLLKGDEDAAKKSKAERQKDKDTKLKLAKEETDYSMPRSKREKEQAKNSATNEFTPDHIHYATMKRVKAYDKTRKTEEASKKHGIATGEWQKHMGSERGVKRKVEKMTRKAGKKEIRQQTQAQEGAFIDQLEPEWSEGKRRLGNELRAKLGMKQLPDLDWKKDLEMKQARTALKARFAEGNALRKRAGLEEKDEWDDSNVWDKESDRWFNSILGDDDEAHYEDWMTAFAQCEPGSKECDILLTHEVFSNMLSDGPLDEFDDLYKAYDEGKADENMIRKYQELAKSHLESDKARFAEGEERSDVQALMREKCEEWLANVQPGSYLGYEDLESDMYDYARGLTHDDLGSGDDLRNFMDNPGDEAGQVVQDVLASNHRVEIEDLFAEGVESQSKEENQVSAILGKALGKSPEEALRYAPGELFSELESVNPELADSIASISSIVYNVKLEEKYDGYYLAQRAADLWHKDNPNKRRDGYFRVGVDVQDEYAEKAGGKKGKYRGHGASEWTTEEVEARPARAELQKYYDTQTGTLRQKITKTEKKFKIKKLRVLGGHVMRSKNEEVKKIGEKLRKSTLPKITQADKDDAVDFLGSIKRTDPNAYKRLIKRLKD
jgi:hypothetical protein